MWNNNKTVTRTYSTSQAQNCWAIISGISGWKKVKTGQKDGVSNVFTALNAARAGGKRVDVYIANNVIERVVMR
ncbi:hypothetical protein [uncultured Litoreibacter sp.]|uniref:hypothetical protein n=1 Tax=uncultured Litoreibacter sp. TaxID=1392394 RepID=UPI002607D399|nr:hypothetical protein [uncultured Litoreibacter sp.]